MLISHFEYFSNDGIIRRYVVDINREVRRKSAVDILHAVGIFQTYLIIGISNTDSVKVSL